MSALAFTGERFVPECTGEIWLEHWHRYRFATAFAKGRRVLDAASGEGYGSALLADCARSVIGADVSAEAVAHARQNYRRSNLRFLAADCARLPFADASFDLVVSFETIEHITAQRAFIAEVRRVLAPGGLLLLSSPNKAEYSDRRAYANPFHVSELYRDELWRLIDGSFPHARWYGQRIGFCSTIAAESPGAGRAGGELLMPPEGDVGPVAEPLYFMLACAMDEASLGRIDPSFSVLEDPAATIYRDYRDTYRKFVAASAAIATLKQREAQHALVREGVAFHKARADRLGSALRSAHDSGRLLAEALDTANARYEAALQSAHAEIRRLDEECENVRAQHRTELGLAEGHVAALRQTVAQQSAELDRRGGWRWRLRLPLAGG